MELSTSAAEVSTFDGQRYLIKGALAVNSNNGKIRRVPNIYYDIRNAVNHQKELIAKRKNPSDELCKCHQAKVK
ncbi:hypothetical protein HCN83_15500 [Bacillus luteus]|uniref:Uncharacterized protein n=1 Tax=Alkalicoccus luteus TaxID=1237094 RepID=A0A969PW41_9BACI|nr:hypothetical protein [Alkalicoccus luteus]